MLHVIYTCVFYISHVLYMYVVYMSRVLYLYTYVCMHVLYEYVSLYYMLSMCACTRHVCMYEEREFFFIIFHTLYYITNRIKS